ncbi:hypothetical protein CEUSTIGMA_g13131.t1 [Chlamydomonas eustigma]|uniref:Uncharacterized protein n=1 Tax=Chlamydomonas eustigma TaxID=1157962 RepID=A0A250XRL3_9CHLO|nr:hypothetical protein CEUSTIGMA_g13131.t1 [Chlamydomonas eustigma]|eukprot:GAX85717.1 hypothetical protein CEUSTIGMA_g13131.t1 [Chlamydomonas eustigma]
MHRLLSIDVGIRHLAYADLLDGKLQRWGTLDLHEFAETASTDQPDRRPLGPDARIRALVTAMDETFFDPSNLTYDVVLIENQPSRKNPDMKGVQVALHTYFATVAAHTSSVGRVVLVSASRKSLPGSTSMSYRQRKDASVAECRRQLETIRDEEALAQLERARKKDDMSDAYLQGIAWWREQQEQQQPNSSRRVGRRLADGAHVGPRHRERRVAAGQKHRAPRGDGLVVEAVQADAVVAGGAVLGPVVRARRHLEQVVVAILLRDEGLALYLDDLPDCGQDDEDEADLECDDGHAEPPDDRATAEQDGGVAERVAHGLHSGSYQVRERVQVPDGARRRGRDGGQPRQRKPGGSGEQPVGHRPPRDALRPLHMVADGARSAAAGHQLQQVRVVSADRHYHEAPPQVQPPVLPGDPRAQRAPVLLMRTALMLQEGLHCATTVHPPELHDPAPREDRRAHGRQGPPGLERRPEEQQRAEVHDGVESGERTRHGVAAREHALVHEDDAPPPADQ